MRPTMVSQHLSWPAFKHEESAVKVWPGCDSAAHASVALMHATQRASRHGTAIRAISRSCSSAAGVSSVN